MENQNKKTENIDDSTKLNISDELILNWFASVVLVVGIIITIYFGFTIAIVDGVYDKTLNPMGLVITIGILVISLTIWASLKVLSNISISLKELNNK